MIYIELTVILRLLAIDTQLQVHIWNGETLTVLACACSFSYLFIHYALLIAYVARSSEIITNSLGIPLYDLLSWSSLYHLASIFIFPVFCYRNVYIHLTGVISSVYYLISLCYNPRRTKCQGLALCDKQLMEFILFGFSTTYRNIFLHVGST